MRRGGWLVGLVLVAGCIGPSGTPLEEPQVPRPVDLLLSEPVRIDREQPAREPAIVQAADGSLYVAGFWGFARHTEYQGGLQNVLQGPLVWKSADEGRSWARLMPGTPINGAISNSDLDLAVDSEGRLYLAALSYYSLPLPPGAPADPASTLSVVVGVTDDGGATWEWALIDQGPDRSHPWLTVDPEGVPHLVWGVGTGSGIAPGIRHAVSPDHGASWLLGPPVHRTAREAGGIVTSPNGTLAVRTTTLSGPLDPGDDGVVVSKDNGQSWLFREVPALRSHPETPRGFDSIAFDGAGRLYFGWTDGRQVLLARSQDLGASWDVMVVAEEPEGSAPYFPYLRGGAEDRVAMAWFRSQDGTVACRVALVAETDSETPEIIVASFSDETGGTNHADYYQVALLSSGAVAAAVPTTTPDLGQWFDFRVASPGTPDSL